jgi:hypothetical protein
VRNWKDCPALGGEHAGSPAGNHLFLCHVDDESGGSFGRHDSEGHGVLHRSALVGALNRGLGKVFERCVLGDHACTGFDGHVRG